MNTTTLLMSNPNELVWMGLVLGFGIMLINIKLRSPLLWLAASICFIGTYFEPFMSDTYYRVGVGIIVLFCWIMATFNFNSKRRGNG